MKVSDFAGTVLAVIILQALVNFLGLFVLAVPLFKLVGTSAAAAAGSLLFVLLVTSVINYLLFVGAIKNHFRNKQRFE